MQGRP